MIAQILTVASETLPTTNTLDVIRSFVGPVVMLVMGVVILTALINRRMTQAIIMIMVSAVTAVLVYGFESFTALFTNPLNSGSSEPSTEKSGTPTPATPEQNSSTSIDIPWEILGFSILALIVLTVVIVGCVFAFDSYVKHSRNRTANLAGWEKLIDRHNEVRKQWSSYEMDMAKIIDYPFMNDMKEPSVTALHGVLRKAKHLEPSSVKIVSHIPYSESPFSVAVHDLEVAFAASEREAKRVAWSKFTPEERKSLATAKNLLAMALDQSSSASERQVAYKRVIKELSGIVSIPAQAVLAIESANSLELESV